MEMESHSVCGLYLRCRLDDSKKAGRCSLTGGSCHGRAAIVDKGTVRAVCATPLFPLGSVSGFPGVRCTVGDNRPPLHYC